MKARKRLYQTSALLFFGFAAGLIRWENWARFRSRKKNLTPGI